MVCRFRAGASRLTMALTGIIVQLTGVLSTLRFPDLQVEVKTSSTNRATSPKLAWVPQWDPNGSYTKRLAFFRTEAYILGSRLVSGRLEFQPMTLSPKP